MGDRLRTFESGETPHESNYTAGRLADLPREHRQGLHPRATPTGAGPVKIGPLHDALKGDRWFEIVRNSDFKVDPDAGTWARSSPRPDTPT